MFDSLSFALKKVKGEFTSYLNAGVIIVKIVLKLFQMYSITTNK